MIAPETLRFQRRVWDYQRKGLLTRGRFPGTWPEFASCLESRLIIARAMLERLAGEQPHHVVMVHLCRLALSLTKPHENEEQHP